VPALLVVAVIAVLDALLSTHAVLVELLAAGPLVAAVRSTPRETAIVGVVALAVSVPLGLANDMFTSLQHLVGTLTVVVGSVLAVGFARLRTNREDLLSLERTARMEATRARDELRAMLSGIADAVTGQSPDGRLVYANDAALELLGYSTLDELLAAPPVEIMARYEILDENGDEFPLENLPGRRALMGEGQSEALIRFRELGTGEERWCAVKATPVEDEEGRLIMAINVMEDMTAHKRSEMGERFLSDCSRVLGSSLDMDELLQGVARLAVPGVADWCTMDVIRPDGEVARVALEHAEPDLLARSRELDERYPVDRDGPTGLARVINTGQAELYSEITPEMIRASTRDEEHFHAVQALGPRSAMSVPMVSRGRVLGVLSLVTGRSGRRFDARDLELAEELARRCGTAVDNARLYRDRAYIARTLQESLLPSELPDIPGIEAAARFRPTGEGNEMGGDFYDLFATGDRGWTVVVGDVCGKGPDAAAVTALARYTLRAAAMRDRLPSRGLQMLNEALLRQRSDRRFCTVAYAYLEPVDGHARVGFASGGHPLPLLLRRDGTVETVGAAGTLLGVVPDPTFVDRSLELSRGDAIVFFTDGVIEDRGNGALEESRLALLLGECAGAGADAIAARVENEAIRSQGGVPRDDIAVLVLKMADGASG
jgi:PAS domain S-box-containing protein